MAIASELTINSATALQMAETIFGAGVTVTGATYTGDVNSAGIYSGATTTIPGIVPSDGGVILSTGRVADFTNSSGTTNTNEVANRSTNTSGVDGDSQLNAIAGQATFDGSILQATFVPDGDMITMQFVFSSEEYPEYVNANVNDAFGVWVNGSFVPVSITVAGSVAIDEVNAARNENFYRSNTADQFNTEMDGFTYVLSIKAPVIAGASNTIKIAIADGGDAVWDSNLLIAADSVQTVTLAIDDTINMTANSSRTFDILANDVSRTGLPLTITQIGGQNIVVGQTITLTSGQQVRLNADGTITVFSNSVLGQENFSYTVSDGTNTDVGYIKLNTGATQALDGIVSGTAGDDLIDTSYLGDPDGDRIDNNDGTGVQGTTGDADLIYAGAGNDTVLAGGGNDIIFGGAGDDRATLGDGNDVFGSALDSGTGNDSVLGGAGSDTIWAGDDNDTVDGGSEADSLFGGGGRDLLSGGEGNDTVSGGTGSDTITGGAGDVIAGGEDVGRADNDVLQLSGVQSITYGGGNDEAGTITFTGGGTLSFSEIETIRIAGAVDGTSGNDTIGAGYVDVQGDQRDGTDGTADTIYGYGGDDSINAGAGNDTVYGGAGNDSLAGGTGNDILMGEADADEIRVVFDDGTDTIIGGEGGVDNDLLTLEAGSSGPGYTVTMTGSEAGSYAVAGGASGTFSEIERLTLSAANDTLDGAAAGGSLNVAAGAGNDSVTGGSGADSLAGDAGADLLSGGAGNDTLAGGADADTIQGAAGDVVTGGETTTLGGSDNDVLVVEAGSTITYGGGNDEAGTVTLASGGTLVFSEIETIVFAGPVDGTAGSDTMGPGYTDLNGDQIDGTDGLPDTIYGYGGNDSITAGDGADLVYGGQGDDSLLGRDGNDTVLGDAGNDTLSGDAGDDSLSGGAGDDRITAGNGFGTDTVVGGETAETVGDRLDLSQVTQDLTLDLSEGTPGNAEDGTVKSGTDSITFAEIEEITLGSGDDQVVGSSGNDRVTSGAGKDTIHGGEGNDTFTLGADGEADLIRFGDGDGADTLSGFDGPVTGPGGGLTGVDRIDVSEMADAYGNPVNVNDVTVGDDGNGHARLTFPNGESLVLVGVAPATAANPAYLVAIGIPAALGPDYIVEGTAGDDLIDGSYAGDPEDDRVDAADNATGTNDDLILAADGADTVLAGQGNDTIEGEGGNDSVDGGTGNDLVYGGTGDDTLQGVGGNDTLWGDTGHDSLEGGANDDLIGGGIGNDRVFGGDGEDYLTGNQGLDTIFGGTGNDTVYAGSEADSVDGGTGDDLIEGEAGADSLAGSEGQDQIYGGSENDTLSGGVDNDTLGGGDGADSLSGGEGNDYIDGNAGADVIDGGAGSDTVYAGSEADTVEAGDGADLVYGGDGDDVLGGGIGDDTIYGGNGSDHIDGGDGNDLIQGADPDGGGDDTLAGGAGDDTIIGGTGAEADTIYGGDGNDVITAFGGASDEDIYGGAGNDTITTSGGDFELVYGGDDRDTFVIGSDASMQLDGGAGGDDQDTLNLSNLGKANTEIVYTSTDKEDGYVRILDAQGAETGRIDFTDIETVIPCFTPGTRIQTAAGLKRVEHLCPGDLVLTRDDGYQVLRWTGRRDLSAAELAARPAFAPVSIAAGAMGAGMPRRRMMVSPQHRLLMGGRQAEVLFGEAEVLVAALHLLGQPGITRADVPGVSYIHLLFDNHQIIQSDGLWTESFQPGAATLRGMDAAPRDEVLGLFPELAEGVLFPAARITLKLHEVRVLLAA